VSDTFPPSAPPPAKPIAPMTLKVSCRLTRQDFPRLAGALYAHAMGPWRLVAGLAPPVAAAFAAALGLGAGEALALGEAGSLALAWAAALVALLLVNVVLQGFAYRRQMDEAGAFLRPFQVELDSEGVTTRSEAAATRFTWDAVRNVTVNEEFVLIYTDAAAAVALPARSFRDEASMRAFGERAISLWRAATSLTPQSEPLA
jgi:YcxB-like protein